MKNLKDEEFLEVVAQATEEVMKETFDCPEYAILDESQRKQFHEFGAYIPIMHEDETRYIAFLTSEEICNLLTRELFQSEESDVLTKEEIADAVGEIINMIAGVVQRKLEDRLPNVRLGFPIYVEEFFDGTQPMPKPNATSVKAGQYDVDLVVKKPDLDIG